MTLLKITDLSVGFDTPDGQVQAVQGLNLTLNRGETLGIVGESGSGKSQASFAIMGLLARNGRASGSVLFDGQEILNAPASVLNPIRGARIAMVFQDPMTSLNPYMRISDQMAEVLIYQKGMSKRDALVECTRMLDAVKLPDAKSRIRLYPHEFSGGMRQRVMIAMALLCRPDLLIADEPTTALDVTVQAQIMRLLRDLQAEFGMAMILVTHDLGVVAGSCERVLVLYGGRVMETGPAEALFASPSHPYTQGLLRAIPRVDREDERLRTIPGVPPNMMNMPRGCPFSPRCDYAIAACNEAPRQLESFAPDRARACTRPVEELI
ncbi:oligopeptide/dipeptide ABC transporter ATP-binding protein [Agrobacterium vitis]|uniref:oligopeptide/dipeptide ABC transporter ATP-binding protein n=1 Tax=Agrobacterium vitis TaxID=373 RepID=UPI00087299A4|nr:oligopeptide/dipeptide ABC transporter ATP-binding protein [Agrobacterium vitis]MCE6076916.1 ATP-binding cassette domain-containing protein [Agrobacterium vitis]MUO71763.1 ATP-binding cassette domain-containing protein [Agrobacterium vitis]MUO86159.1 ATP-binding cassette domain-containing protein [Agrobacterium vitis]MVA36859.1 ATP-binding cassette domain-containing protein [Agrobacterium vitis]